MHETLTVGAASRKSGWSARMLRYLEEHGLVVPPRNPEALSDACLVLLRDAELRKRLGAAARIRALQLFTVDQAIEAFDDLYVRVAAGLVPGLADGDGR